MENQLLVSQHNQDSPLSEKEISIGHIIWHVNLLTSFPLSDLQISQWSKTVNRLMPGVEIPKLQKMIDLMLIGKIEWDHKSGIQNIFRGYEKANVFDSSGNKLNY